LNWVCIENGLWIEFEGGVSYAETVQLVQAWKTVMMMMMMNKIETENVEHFPVGHFPNGTHKDISSDISAPGIGYFLLPVLTLSYECYVLYNHNGSHQI